jgi:hypothetical protein
MKEGTRIQGIAFERDLGSMQFRWAQVLQALKIIGEQVPALTHAHTYTQQRFLISLP